MMVPLKIEHNENQTTLRTRCRGEFLPINRKINETVINVPMVEPVLAPNEGNKTSNPFLWIFNQNVPKKTPNHRDRPHANNNPTLLPAPGQIGDAGFGTIIVALIRDIAK